MSSQALTRATEKLERLKAGLAKHKEQAKGAIRRGGYAGAVAAGVAGAAVLDAVMTENSTTAEAVLPGTDNVPLNTAVGALALVAGLAGMGDEYSDHLALIGVGMLSPKIYGTVRAAVEKRG
jgi:hypothetical protein